MSSATLVASNDDLLKKILLGLPNRPLLRSKSVSKHWLALITDPSFSFLRRRAPSGLFLQPLKPGLQSDYRFLPLDDSPISLASPFKTLSFFNDEATIIQSCKGLLLCCESRARPAMMKFYVFNPTSNKFDVIMTDDTSWVDDMCLVFEPTTSRNYKVVCLRNPDLETRSWRIDVYSSETGSWFHTGVCASVCDHYCEFERGVYWKGAVHWISMENKSLYFDIDRQVLLEFPLPSWLMRCRRRKIAYIGESNDHLLLVASDFHFLPSQFDVYELKKDYSEWFVKFKVDFSPFEIVLEGTDEESFLVFSDRGKIMRYHFVCGTSSEIQSCRPGKGARMKFGDTLKFYDYIFAYPFYECLSCVV